MKLSIIIPAYNEGKSVCEVILDARKHVSNFVEAMEIIVVDDGSDNTGYLSSLDSDVKVLRHYVNGGYGNALRTGIKASRYEWILICDGDGSYSFDRFHEFIKDYEHYDMIVGARQGKHYYGPFLKRLARYLQVGLAQFVTGSKIPDVNSGFRLIRKNDVLPLFDFVCRGFSFTTSLTIAMRMMQKQINFVPIAYHKRKGRSHVKIVRDSMRSLQIITQCILRYNPIKAFLLLVMAETGVFLFAGLLLTFSGAGLVEMICLGCFWLGIVFVTLSIGFMTYALQNGSRDQVPVDQGMNVQNKNETLEVPL